MHTLVGKAELFINELCGEFAHRLFQDGVQIIRTDHIVGGIGIQPQEHQHHFDILLDAEQILRRAPGCVRILVLQRQAHGRDGRFDLMRPDGVVFEHIRIARIHIVFERALLAAQLLDDRLIVAVIHRYRLRKTFHQRGGALHHF